MNLDHVRMVTYRLTRHLTDRFQFFLLTIDDILKPPIREGSRKHFVVEKSLHKDFSKVPKKSKTDEDDYTIIMAAPSLVANPYLSSLRIFSYNITGAEDDNVTTFKKKKKEKKEKGKKDCRKKKNRDKWSCRPQKPRHGDANSPSRSNTLWTPLGYSQVSSEITSGTSSH